LGILCHGNSIKRRVWLLMLTDLIFSFAWVIGFFFLAGCIAWLADQVASFHLAGMARVRRLEEKERENEGAR